MTRKGTAWSARASRPWARRRRRQRRQEAGRVAAAAAWTGWVWGGKVTTPACTRTLTRACSRRRRSRRWKRTRTQPLPRGESDQRVECLWTTMATIDGYCLLPSPSASVGYGRVGRLHAWCYALVQTGFCTFVVFNRFCLDLLHIVFIGTSHLISPRRKRKAGRHGIKIRPSPDGWPF